VDPILLPLLTSTSTATFTYIATAETVALLGAKPVYVDIDPRTYNLNPALLEAAITSKTKAIIPVSLYGQCADFDQINAIAAKHNIPVIEDAAQSFGASYQGIPSGKMGDISVLSFDPTKNLNNYGSGGMILTDDFHLYETCRGLRDNGKIIHDTPGTNSKMSEADCAQMLVKLNHFDAWQRRRREIAEYYIDQLYQYVDILTPNEGVEHAWHKFVIRTNHRNSLMSRLSLDGIETKMHYESALYDLGVGFNYIDYSRDLFTETSSFTRECLSLPIYPELTDSEVESIVESVKEFKS
jgi:UDP-2-acetamido-2-deoxy-ribo-hexuluronate aminotransferase